jgi:D-tyrosyl-tRNA(Tyr) deacylase
MRAVVQRVSHCILHIDGYEYSRINNGLLVLVGIEDADNENDVEWLSAKVARLRIFDDPEVGMGRSISDVNGNIMIVSQFTLHASTRKGNRPSFTKAARPEKAIPLYEMFINSVNALTGTTAATGKFGASMQINLLNDGPVTILIDSKSRE